jgi:photosystem II stability/assembly factor-like uncharacterized protein
VYLKPVVKAVNVPPAVIERGDYLYGIAQLGSERLIAVGSRGKIWTSMGPTASWARLASPIKTTLQDVDSWDALNAVAVGDNGEIIVTRDGGSTWSKAAPPRSKVANKLLRVRTAGQGVAWAVGEAGAVLKSEDYGQTWTRARAEEDVAWNGVWIQGSRIWIVGEFGSVSFSADNGRTWTKQNTPIQGSLMAVAFKDAVSGVAVGVDGAILTTADGGLTWIKRELRAKDHFYDVIWDADRWAAVGDKGLLAMSDANGEAWQVVGGKDSDRRWHTKILRFGSGYALTGASFLVVDRTFK